MPFHLSFSLPTEDNTRKASCGVASDYVFVLCWLGFEPRSILWQRPRSLGLHERPPIWIRSKYGCGNQVNSFIMVSVYRRWGPFYQRQLGLNPFPILFILSSARGRDFFFSCMVWSRNLTVRRRISGFDRGPIIGTRPLLTCFSSALLRDGWQN